MTLKEFIVAAKGAIVSGAKRVFKALLAADIISIVKVGVLVGSAAVTAIAILRYMKQKRRLFNNEEKKSVVDRALQLNFSDMRNVNALDPMMHTVKKRLTKDSKPRSKKKYKNKKGSWNSYVSNIDTRNMQSSKKGPLALQELERFRRDMDIIERGRLNERGNDGYSLRRCWENS